jgi:hypothetical protein
MYGGMSVGGMYGDVTEGRGEESSEDEDDDEDDDEDEDEDEESDDEERGVPWGRGGNGPRSGEMDCYWEPEEYGEEQRGPRLERGFEFQVCDLHATAYADNALTMR